jgi:acyl dehydratase
LDPSAVGAQSAPTPLAWTSKDCALYALGVGAGTSELAFTTGNTSGLQQRMLPTMPVIMGLDTGVFEHAGRIDWTQVVHAEQAIELIAEMPAEGTARATTRITQMWDKGKAAVLVTQTEAVGETGAPLFRTRSAIFVRGAGGWGGDRGPSPVEADLSTPPDVTMSYPTREDQALLYRLSGDYNPLHSDPSFAARAGFDRPILHGLCTYGFTGRALLHGAAGGDPARVKSMSARFASPVYPGDTLTVDLWHGGGETVHFRTRRDDGTVVLSHGIATIAASAG